MFRVGGAVHTSTHLTMMFGGIASVHAWHRIACLLRAIARRLLYLPLMMYVDDYFSIDRAASAQGAMQSFARLVRACLGPDAISERKLEHGNPLVVLGVEATIDEGGATFWPAQDKVDKWSASIDAFLARKVMRSGEASKLSWQLQ